MEHYFKPFTFLQKMRRALAKNIYLKLAPNVWCYTKEAIISTKVDAEYKCLFNHKCFCGVQNRLFCIARVIGCFSVNG